MRLTSSPVGPLRAARAIPLALFAVACATTHPENPALDAFPPGVTGSTDVTYYDVHGATARELVAQMRQLGPKTETGASFFGETQSPMRWQWSTRSNGQSCTANGVSVYIRSEITLPRWMPPPDAPPALVEQWKQFLAALETHEIGHKDISARAARDVLTAVRRLDTMCSSFSAEAKRVTDGIVARLKVEQTTYDAQTRHGATQGATFPPRPIAGSGPPR
jgi:predicted secreted Zn-dependent protease